MEVTGTEEVPNEETGLLEERDLYTVKEGAPDAPAYPVATVYKSGEINLTWNDDIFC